MESPSSFFIIMLFSVVRCEHITLGSLKSIPKKVETKVFSCQPNVTYVQDLSTCVCRSNGEWPMKCSAQFSKLYSHIRHTCNPDTYVQVHCNVCKCDSVGVINYDKCTRHPCERNSRKLKNYSRKSTKSVAGTCTPKMWYSYSACQLCFCVNDTRLVCSTVNGQMGTVLFGKYNFTICGKSFLEDTFSIVPNAKKIFRMDNTEQYKVYDTQLKESEEEEEEEQEDEALDEEEKIIEPVKNTVEEASSENEYDSEEGDKATPNEDEAITKMPYQDESNRMLNVDSKLDVDPVEGDRSVLIKPSFFYPEQLANDDNEPQTGNFLRQSKKAGKGKSTNQQFIEASVAEVLKQVLDSRKYDFRKMVTLRSNGTCLPGKKMVVDCNTCFCMRNGKLLCTKKLCLY